MRKTLRQLMQESDKCIFAPCVYDCSSARAMEMAGYEALMFSSGEYSPWRVHQRTVSTKSHTRWSLKYSAGVPWGGVRI